MVSKLWFILKHLVLESWLQLPASPTEVAARLSRKRLSAAPGS